MTRHRIASAAAVLLCAGAALWGPVASAQTPSPSPSGSSASPSGSSAPSPSASASAPAEAGLALLLSAEPPAVAVGDEAVLVAQVTNTGEAATPGTSLTIALPPELELEESFPPAASSAGGTHTFELGPLDPGESVVAQVTATAVALVQDATVTATATGGSASATDSVSVSVTEGGGSAGLSVSSRAAGVLTQVGSMVHYEVVVSNDGETDLQNVLVVDVAPAEVDVVSVDIVDEVEAVQVGESGGRHDIVWNVGSLPAGTSVELPWDGRATRAGDLRAVNSVRGLLGNRESARSSSESFLAAEGARDVDNPPFDPIEERVVTFVDPPPSAGPHAAAATQPGAVLPFTGASPWEVVRAGLLLCAGGLLLVLGTRLAREPRKALVAAVLAGTLGVACVSASDHADDSAAPVASPRTFTTDDPRDDGARVKGERIVRGEEEGEDGADASPAPPATPAPSAPPATAPPATLPPTATPPPAVAAPATAPPPADPAPVRVVSVVTTELEDLPIAQQGSREGDNTISFRWDEAAGGITAASSGTTLVRGEASELLTDLSSDDAGISNRMTLRNTAEATRLRLRGRLVHDVYRGSRLVARLRSAPLDVLLAPGGEVAARFSYLLPAGDYTVRAAFESSQ